MIDRGGMTMKIDTRWLGTVALGALAFATPAFGQAAAASQAATPTTGDGSGIKDIIVTAERRTNDVQHTALAITALSGDELTRVGATNAMSLISAVPGFGVSNTAQLQTIFIRGVGGGQVNNYGDPAVSYSVDGAYIQRPYGGPSGTYYDLDRVEVLKGPQGTLYGRNATVGAMNVITKAPRFEFGDDVGAEFGNYGDFQANGALNIPLSDTVATRFAFKVNQHDGYLTNGRNDAKSVAGRASILFKPRDGLSLRITADYFHDTPKGPQQIFIYQQSDSQKFTVPDSPWFGLQLPPCAVTIRCPTLPTTFLTTPIPAAGVDPFTDNKVYSLKADLEYDLGPATLTVIPAYVNSNIAFRSYTGGYESNVSMLARQYSLETRLGSSGSGPLKWVVGAFYYAERARAHTDFSQAQGFIEFNVPHQNDTSYAVFGQATYSLTHSLRLTGGLRWTKEEKSQDGYTLLPNVPAATCTGSGATLEPGPEIPLRCHLVNTGGISDTDVTWKAGVEFDAGPRSLLYANVSTGFKAGGLFPGAAPNTYLPEHLTAYQIGSKNRFFDNRLQLNLEAFYWDYKDQQVYSTTNVLPAGLASRPVNEDGWLEGVEVELVVALTRHDRFSANLVYEDGKYTRYTNPGASFFIPPATTIVVVPASTLTNVARPAIPKLNGTVSYEHTFDLAKGADVVFGASSHFESGAWFDLTHRADSYRDAYAMVDARLTYNAPEGKWSIGLFVNNITNKAVVYGGNSVIFQKSLAYVPPNANAWSVSIYPPRTYGIRASARF